LQCYAGESGIFSKIFEQEKTETTEGGFKLATSPFPLLPPVQIVCLVAPGRVAPFAPLRGSAIGLLWQIQAASVKITQVVDFQDSFR
jgi:hypothetical protein